MAIESLFSTTFTYGNGDVSVSGLLLFALTLTIIVHEWYRWSLRIPAFDGPWGAPIVGNIWELYGKNVPEQYQLWSRKYGDVFQVQLGNKAVLVINTAAAARQILAAKPAATSSRPTFYTLHKLVSKGSATTIGSTAQSDSLKARRKVFATALNKPAVARHTPFIDAETKQLIKDMYSASGRGDGKTAVDPVPFLLRMNLSMGFTLHWGSRVSAEDDTLFREITEVESAISDSRSMTSNYQDYVPLLRLLGPLSSASAAATNIGERRAVYMSRLDAEMDARIAEGTQQPCIRGDSKQDPESKLNEHELTSLNMTATAGGLDTMQSTLSWALAVLAMRPDIQDKILADIRTMYPTNRPLCDANDQQSLDYVMAFVRETTRVYPPTPLSLPRETTSDFWYQEKLIPKGSILVLNSWACNRDPEIWSDPDIFRPERWLEQPEAPTFSFGLGSRMCIGIHLAHRELYTVLTRVVNSFRVSAVDSEEIELDSVAGVASAKTTVAMPRRYRVRFEARNPEALSAALQEG